MASSFTPIPGSRVLALLHTALKGMQFGTVEITVHDGRITQIERRERTRVISPGLDIAASLLELETEQAHRP